MESRFFTTPHQDEIEYRLTGPPGHEAVLLLHGWGLDCRSFYPNWSFFSSNFQVLAPSLSGHGLSRLSEKEREAPGRDQRFIRDVQDLCWSLGIQRLHLVGVGWGGYLAYRWLQLAPHQVLSLTSIGAPLGIDLKLRMRRFFRRLRRGGHLHLGYQRKHQLARMLSLDPFHQQKIEKELLHWVRSDWIKGLPDHVYQKDFLRSLEASQIPILIIQGSQDFLLEGADTSKLPGLQTSLASDFHFIAGAGHLAHLDQSARFHELWHEQIFHRLQQRGKLP